jgi:hypothetical protein
MRMGKFELFICKIMIKLQIFKGDLSLRDDEEARLEFKGGC